MPATRTAEPSPLAIGIGQLGLSLAVFGGVAALVAALVAFAGDESAGAPIVEVALFEEEDGPPPALKTRLASGAEGAPLDSAHGEAGSHQTPAGENLAVAASFTITEVDGETGAGAPPVIARDPLPKAPIPGLFERTSAGDLPRIGADGLKPSEAYARPFKSAAGAPRISVVVSGLGLKDIHTKAAIHELPPEVTLSFVPYAPKLQSWVDQARAAGHEVLLELPMETYDYPNVDTGPHTLLTSASAEENVRRLNLLLGKTSGYFGVINYQGAKFATDGKAAAPVLSALKSRGLAFLHDGAATRSALPEVAKAAGLSFRIADRVVDFEPTADSIDRELLQLEALALENGAAIGIGYAYPVTIEQLRIWTESLKAKGYQLAPASANLGVIASEPARRNGT